MQRLMSISHIQQEHKCRLEQCSEQSEQEHVSHVHPGTVSDYAVDPNA